MDLQEIKRREYEQQQVVTALMQRVLRREAADQEPDVELAEALAQAEAELNDLEQLRVDAQKSDPARPGRIIDAIEADSRYEEMRRGATRGPATTGLQAEGQLRMAQVPTAIYHLLDPSTDPLVVCEVTNVGDSPRRLRVETFIEGYSAHAVDTAEINKNETKSFALLPTLFRDRLAGVTELTSASINLRIEDIDGALEMQRSMPVRLLSRNYVPLAVRNPVTSEWNDLSRYLGAFVTPNAPEIIDFLRTVAEHHPRGRLVGYLSKSPEDSPESQVRAVFEALRAAGTRYIHSVTAFNPDVRTFGQRIRLPREALATPAGNCIDGTLLVASLLEAASLNPAIVLLPGHAFVGWAPTPGKDDWDYLETTLIGGSKTFEEACESARKKAAIYEPRAATDKLAFRRWSIAELRVKHGITPLE